VSVYRAVTSQNAAACRSNDLGIFAMLDRFRTGRFPASQGDAEGRHRCNMATAAILYYSTAPYSIYFRQS